MKDRLVMTKAEEVLMMFVVCVCVEIDSSSSTHEKTWIDPTYVCTYTWPDRGRKRIQEEKSQTIMSRVRRSYGGGRTGNEAESSSIQNHNDLRVLHKRRHFYAATTPPSDLLFKLLASPPQPQIPTSEIFPEPNSKLHTTTPHTAIAALKPSQPCPARL